MTWLRTILLAGALLFAGVAAFANDAGGGAAGVGANVTLSTTSTTATLSNGVITATIQKSTGKVTSYLFNGTQMVDTSGQIYYSFDGGASFDVPSGCVYSVTASTADMVDISCKRTWNATAGYKHALDIDVHWVLRRGDTGLYGYIALAHPAAYPATGFGEFRVVWKLPHSSTAWSFERVYVDALRNWNWGTYTDFTSAQSTSIAEVIRLVTGVRAGQYDCKYQYAAEYQEIGCWGHASNSGKKGVWMVMGGYDYLNDGPNKVDLTLAESYNLIHFGRNHFGGSSTSLAAGEAWRKIYGPHLLYCNSTTATTNAGDALWADAKAQTTAEIAAWPYAWMSHADYPLQAGRGTVTGRLLVSDALKPGTSGANAWVGVAAPEDTAGNWQYQGKGYQTWVRADASGNFTIRDVRPGSYTLYAFTNGATGEFSRTAVTVTANASTALGNLTWTIPRVAGESLAWEIGTPNRSASEFRHGTDYWTPFLWNTYCTELANPLEYTIGTSNPAIGWNYAHSGHVSGGGWTPWKWRIRFNLAAVPPSGNATLTIALAGAESARIDIYVNDEANLLARFYPANSGGNALIREGIHSKYSVQKISIPVSELNVGANTITLVQGRTGSASEHVMYDSLALTLPPFPPPPPNSGRSLLWKGGSTAATNIWDLGATASFLSGAAAAAFGTGDAVTFDATGSNTTSITLTGAIAPNALTFTGTKNYTLAGTGVLTGQMPLVKSGSGNLSVSTAQSFAGPTTISGGQIVFTSDAASLGTSDITLKGGTLSMYSDFNTYNDISWDLDVPTGFSGTLNCDARCNLYGELNGGGTLTCYIPQNRTEFDGDWSGFSGQLYVTSDASGGDFRIGTDYSPPGLPNAAVNLGTLVSMYYVGILNDGNGTTIPLGELTSTNNTAMLRGGITGGRMLTYRIGGRGTDFTYAGSIAEQSGSALTTHIVKTGPGIWTLSGTLNTNGRTIVEAGTLRLTGTLTNPAANPLEVQDGAALDLPGGTVNTGLHIADGGLLTGAGTINGALLNEGTVALGAGTLTVAGDIENNGTMTITGGAALATAGTFINNGMLDLLTASSALPANLVNTGIVIENSERRILTAAKSGANFTVTVRGYAGHTYQLQRTDTLGGTWTNIGPTFAGTGNTLTFTDPGGATGTARFYRVIVSP